MADLADLEALSIDELRAELEARKAGADRSLSVPPAAQLEQFDEAEIVEVLSAKQRVVYGVDDRVDIFQLTDAAAIEDADSVVALFRASDVTDNGDGTSTLTTQNFGTAFGLCASEPFRDQPVGAFCSGFLVDQDVIATAGHCVNASNVTNVRFVFGFRMENQPTARTVIANAQIYRGVEVIGREQVGNGADWALVRVDRQVPDHPVVEIRRTGRIPDNEPVHVIGHPSGLPTKFAGGASVRNNTPAAFFVANLDTYGGNSGSPVFNANTHEVEGVLVRGENDFVQQGNCTVSLVCPNTGCRGEDCTRTTEFARLVAPAPGSALGGDFALVRQTPGWASIPVAFSNGDGSWTITNGAADPDFIPSWANQPGVRVIAGDFNGNGLTDLALVRQTPGWASIPVAFSNGDGSWTITNGAADPDFIPSWANQPGVRVIAGDFNGNGLTDLALVRQTPGWASIPVAFSNGDGSWTITNGAADPDFIPSWANQPGVRVIAGDFNGNGLTDLALVRQTPGWASIPVAFSNGDGSWTITNGAADPDFIPSWANQPGVRVIAGDFNGNGLTDLALVRQTPGWASIPVAFSNGDGSWTITNGAADPDFIPSWANQPGVRVIAGDFNGNGLTDLALVRQTPGWASIPVAFSNGDGSWTITNGAADPDFIPSWANQPGVRVIPGDFNGNGLTDLALVRQTPGWASIPVAFSNGDGSWTITNGAADPDFIPSWANQPGVRVIAGDYH